MQQVPAALAGIRVLDLTTNYAAYAGRLLADLGADVVRLEPPEGSPVRKLAPFQRGPNGECSSFAHAFKRWKGISPGAYRRHPRRHRAAR